MSNKWKLTTHKRKSLDSFWNRITKMPNGCWIMNGSTDKGGYVKFQYLRKRWRAHRWAWLILFGKTIKKGLELDHTCRNPACCNPEHLEPVTHAENVRRGDVGKFNGTKTYCPQGHPYKVENTYIYGGSRYCRECRRKYNRESQRRRRAGIHNLMGRPKVMESREYSL